MENFPGDQSNLESRDPQSLSNIMPEVMAEIIARHEQGDLLAARWTMLELEAGKNRGEPVEEAELQEMRQKVIRLEHQYRTHGVTPDPKLNKYIDLARAHQNLQSAREDSTGDIVSLEIIDAAKLRIRALEQELADDPPVSREDNP